WLWLTVAYVSLFSLLVVAPFLVLGPIVMARHFGGAQDWAAVASAYGCGAVAGSLVAIKIGHPRTLLVACAGLALFAAPTALLATYAPLPAIVTASAVGGIGIGVFNALYITVLQQEIPQQIMSRVVAYDWLGSAAALPLGFVAAGALASVAGPRLELAA